tara:strand:- start:1815 stop:2297 length:483 start_codon:yes stop_codon:yes gene_type:complete
MFLEIKIRKDGEEKWVDAKKFFKYMLEEYSKVTYEGRVVEPYPDRVNKYYDNIPDTLMETWRKAYPNVDIKQELLNMRAWLLSNTNKAKKNFNRFSNQWLARAMQNGGSIGMSFTNKSELVIEKKMKEFRKRQEIAEQDSAPKDWVKDLISQTKRKMQNK